MSASQRFVLRWWIFRRSCSAFGQEPERRTTDSSHAEATSGTRLYLRDRSGAGTGTSGGGVCLRENRRRGCGFGLTGRRWRCGRSARLRILTPAQSLDGAPATRCRGTTTHGVGLRWDRRRSASDATGDGGQDYNWVSGRATSVLIDPADASGNTVLLGGAYGGLWKSTNAGSLSSSPASVTWQALIDDQPTLAVGAIALQPGNSNVILVGTGETNSSGDSYYGLGILRSTDGGSTWTQITGTAANSGPIVSGNRLQQDCLQHGESQPGGGGGGRRQRLVPGRGIAPSETAALPGPARGWEFTGARTLLLAERWSDMEPRHPFGRRGSGLGHGGDLQPEPGNERDFLRFHPAARAVFLDRWAATSRGWRRSRPRALRRRIARRVRTRTTCPIYRGEFAVVPGRNEMYVWIVDVQSDGNGNPTPVDEGIWRSLTSGGNGAVGRRFRITASRTAATTRLGRTAAAAWSRVGTTWSWRRSQMRRRTDVYAGAVNLYKCTLAGGTTCTQGDWINLTHVYGCSPLGGAGACASGPARNRVHWLRAAQSPGYFAHDGGISRTLDGYSGLTTGSCSGTNQFDSLSQTLGSMTEFVSVSVHPTNADIMLGGTQDNGSPKTSTATDQQRPGRTRSAAMADSRRSIRRIPTSGLRRIPTSRF